MKKTILMAVLLAGTAFASNASAATTTVMYGTFNINVSPDIGSGTFGTITVTDNGGNSALVTETTGEAPYQEPLPDPAPTQ